jgi:hypothetical protein
MRALNNSQPVRRCEHVSAKGKVCYRPVMHGRSLCYIHLDDPALQDEYCKTNLELPAIGDLPSIRLAENQVLSAVSAGDIHPSHASVYMYGFQIARQNAKQLPNAGNGKTEKRAE